jgi:molybdopterin-guanine dinucleotide biosynthesis protein A/hemerythrin superfamily protein
MKRDPRLRRLSSDHHAALALARALARRAEAGTLDAALVADVRGRFGRDLDPHFRVEEEVLLPPLRALGDADLAARVEADHAALRAHLAAAGRGDHGRLADFARLLVEHVRFEERALFPRCEAALPAALDALARRDAAVAPPLVAGIFVGGASARFGGSPKGLLAGPAGGTLVDALRGHCEALAIPCVLVGRRPEYAHLDVETLDDEPAGVGPLGGLAALLRRAGAGRCLAVGCDMPFVSRALLGALADADADAPAVAARRGDRWEPMFARYDAPRALPVALARLESGARSMRGLLDALGAAALPLSPDEQRQLDDWDTPEDRERR